MTKIAAVPLSVPSLGSAGETGHWRTERPILEESKCINCLFCWMYCPEGSIHKGEKVVWIDYRFCKGCGICMNECPTKAITMVKEE